MLLDQSWRSSRAGEKSRLRPIALCFRCNCRHGNDALVWSFVLEYFRGREEMPDSTGRAVSFVVRVVNARARFLDVRPCVGPIAAFDERGENKDKLSNEDQPKGRFPDRSFRRLRVAHKCHTQGRIALFGG